MLVAGAGAEAGGEGEHRKRDQEPARAITPATAKPTVMPTKAQTKASNWTMIPPASPSVPP